MYPYNGKRSAAPPRNKQTHTRASYLLNFAYLLSNQNLFFNLLLCHSRPCIHSQSTVDLIHAYIDVCTNGAVRLSLAELSVSRTLRATAVFRNTGTRWHIHPHCFPGVTMLRLWYYAPLCIFETNASAGEINLKYTSSTNVCANHCIEGFPPAHPDRIEVLMCCNITKLKPCMYLPSALVHPVIKLYRNAQKEFVK